MKALRIAFASLVAGSGLLYAGSAQASAEENISGYSLRAYIEYWSQVDSTSVASVASVFEVGEIQEEAPEEVQEVREEVATAISEMSAIDTSWEELLVVDPSQSIGWLVTSEGEVVLEYGVAVGKNGLGGTPRSGKTPYGAMLVTGSVIGEHQEILKARTPTGRIAEENVAGQYAYVTTALLTLRGLEDHNASTAGRNIYFHGTNKTASIGQGYQSGGCIRLMPEVATFLAERAQEVDLGVYVLNRPWENS